jgi:hypothetical protein
VQTITCTTAYTGASVATAALVLCKPLATIPIVTAGVAGERNLVMQMPSLPQIQDGACLAWLYFAGANTAASSQIMGSVDFAWG